MYTYSTSTIQHTWTYAFEHLISLDSSQCKTQTLVKLQDLNNLSITALLI